MKGNKETEVMCRKRVKSTGKAVKRKTVMLMMAVMLIIVSFAGCGNKKEETGGAVNDETKTISESEQQNPENETEEVSDDVFADIFDDIELNGKKVTFPFSLNELGDEYTIDDEPFAVDDENNLLSYYLYYNEQTIAYIDYKAKKTSDVNRDSKIVEYYTVHDKENFKIRGIGINDEIKEIFDVIPNLCFFGKEESEYSGYMLANQNNYIEVSAKNNKIIQFKIRSEK